MLGKLEYLPCIRRAAPKSRPGIGLMMTMRTPLILAAIVGLPAAMFRPVYEPGSYVAFLGRLTAEKGPEAAIRIARAGGMPLHIAAKVPRGETGYFKKHLEPKIDGEYIQLTGKVTDKARRRDS
jgi:glycosyltransferase involved in cell wall biosynthesis